MSKHITKILLFLIISCSYLLMFLDEGVFIFLTREDHLIEYLGAISFFLASILFFVSYSKSMYQGNNIGILKTKRNIFYLLLGLMFFFAFAEEISWGQRIFGWSSSEIFQKTNIQDETNVHNLVLFVKSGFSFTRLFVLFCAIYCLIIPLTNKFIERLNRFYHTLNLPIVPIWLGLLFLTNYIVIHIIEYSGILRTERIYWGVIEIKETNYAFLFFIVSCLFLIDRRKYNKVTL